MIKGLLIIGTVLATFAFVGMRNDRVDEEPTVETKAPKKVMRAATFDDDYLSFINSKTIPDVVINVDTRYFAKISKKDLFNAKSVSEIFPEEASNDLSAISETRVVLIKEDGDEEVWGNSAELNSDQHKLISQLDYGKGFYLESYGLDHYLQRKKVVYFFSVTPENPAQYEGGGKVGLSDFLRAQSLDATGGIKQEKLRPGRILFSINKLGEVTNAEITSTSGYEDFDTKMLELIQDLPENWKPASNDEGEAIMQELTLFFGTQGC